MEEVEAEKRRKEVAGIVFGVVAGAAPWLLDKVGIEMPVPLVYVFLFASVFLIAWALINLGWFESLPFCSRKVSFGTAVLLCSAVVACSTIFFFYKPKPSLEEQLKKWAYQNGLTVQRASDAACSFGLFIGFPNANRVGICRLVDKNRDRYLEMTVIVAPDADDQKLIDGWPQEKKARLISVLTLEIARTKVDYELTAPLPEYRGIRLRRAVPINNDLNEQSFLDYLSSLDNAIILASQQFNIIKNSSP